MENNNNKLNAYINNLIALRAVYYSIIAVITGGLFGLFYHISKINIILFVLCLFINIVFAIKIKITSKRILLLIQRIRG